MAQQHCGNQEVYGNQGQPMVSDQGGMATNQAFHEQQLRQQQAKGSPKKMIACIFFLLALIGGAVAFFVIASDDDDSSSSGTPAASSSAPGSMATSSTATATTTVPTVQATIIKASTKTTLSAVDCSSEVDNTACAKTLESELNSDTTAKDKTAQDIASSLGVDKSVIQNVEFKVVSANRALLGTQKEALPKGVALLQKVRDNSEVFDIDETRYVTEVSSTAPVYGRTGRLLAGASSANLSCEIAYDVVIPSTSTVRVAEVENKVATTAAPVLSAETIKSTVTASAFRKNISTMTVSLAVDAPSNEPPKREIKITKANLMSPPVSGPYDDSHIHRISVKVNRAYWDELRKVTNTMKDIIASVCSNKIHPSKWKWYDAMNITVNGIPAEGKLEIRKKGLLGSMHQIRPGIKLKTSKPITYFDGEKISRFTLNGGHQVVQMGAWTFMNECIAYKIFRDFAGLPAPRCTYALLSINDVSVGMYQMIEPYREEFLDRWFTRPNGQLIEGALSDFFMEKKHLFEFKQGLAIPYPSPSTEANFYKIKFSEVSDKGLSLAKYSATRGATLPAGCEPTAISRSPDWIEFYNAEVTEIADISGWKLCDKGGCGGGNSLYTFPANTKIKPGEYLTVCRWNDNARNSTLSKANFFEFGIGSNDLIVLLDLGDRVVDSSSETPMDAKRDESWSRNLDSNSTNYMKWTHTSSPTPGMVNAYTPIVRNGTIASSQVWNATSVDDDDYSIVDRITHIMDDTTDKTQLETALSPYLHMDNWYKFWTLEVLLQHADGYNGNKNNFFMYYGRLKANKKNEAKRLHFMPWGLDATLGPDLRAFFGFFQTSIYAESRIANELYNVDKQKYQNEMQKTINDIWRVTEITAEIDRVKTMMEPLIDWVEIDESKSDAYFDGKITPSSYDIKKWKDTWTYNVGILKSWIINRARTIRARLGESWAKAPSVKASFPCKRSDFTQMVPSGNDKFVKMVFEKKSYVAARSHCQSRENGQLAHVKSELVNSQLRDLTAWISDDFWFGLRHKTVDGSYKWSWEGSAPVETLTSTSYAPWDPSITANLTSLSWSACGHMCSNVAVGGMERTGAPRTISSCAHANNWVYDDCSTTKNFACETSWDTVGDLKYKFFHTELEWLTALKTCNSFGASLAKVNTEAQAMWLRSQHNSKKKYLWIGLSQVQEKYWRWTADADWSNPTLNHTGTRPNTGYQNFLDDLTDYQGRNENCVSFCPTNEFWCSESTQMLSIPCNGPAHFACSKAI